MANNAKELFDKAIAELKLQLDLGHSEALTRYLDCVGRFHRYSWRNVLLITMQCPNATCVAGFRRWKELDRHVRKGEKGIGILAPLLRRQRDGEPGADEGEKVLTGFRVVYVFDVSQTVGKELPQLSTPIGDASDALSRLEVAIAEAKISLRYEQMCDGLHGYSRPGEIGINEALPTTVRFVTVVHELAHLWLHHHQDRGQIGARVCETEAEACAFVVAKACGIDCAASSSDYIQLYHGDSDLLGKSLRRIQLTSNQILDAMTHRPERQISGPVTIAA